MSATACWQANTSKAMQMVKNRVLQATKERQDLQNTLASVGYFLSRDTEGKLQLWTCSLNAKYTGPCATGETFDSVEEAYAKVFRNAEPDQMVARNGLTRAPN
jgi:hypothetical protein